ncbi:MAG TPA: hypothetical protein VEZ14_05275 [Dehalococcoidia bacterium]|nr:hypothetical protein [Dehalococcoidia bacterium]
MTPDQVTQAVHDAINGSGESIIEGTVVAMLPMLWFALIAIHLARPYILRVVTKFSLRLGADLWWLVYASARDILLVVIFVMSIQFFFVDPFIANPFPMTGGLAAVCALGALVIKLIWDADDDPLAFYAVSVLIAAGSVLYLVPTLLGVQATDFGNVSTFSKLFISSDHPVFAAALTYANMALAGALGMVAVVYVVFFHASPARDLPEEGASTAAGA